MADAPSRRPRPARFPHPCGPGGEPLVLHVVNGRLFEPDRRYRQSRRPTPLKYYRRPVAGFDGIDGLAYEDLQNRIVDAGGLETWAIWDFLLGCAANRSWGRWFFLGGVLTSPRVSSIAAIAAMIRVDPELVCLAVDVLTSPEVAALEWAPMPSEDELRPSELDPPDPSEGPGGSEEKGADGEPQPVGKTVDEKIGVRRQRSAGPGKGSPSAGVVVNSGQHGHLNYYKNENDNGLPGRCPGTGRLSRAPAEQELEQPACSAGPATGHANHPGTSDDTSPATDYPAGNTDPGTSTRTPNPLPRHANVPADLRSVCQPPRDATGGGGPLAPSAAPSAVGGRHPGGLPGGPRGSPRAWTREELAHASQEDGGHSYADLVCRALGFPIALSRRERGRQHGVFAAKFREACDLVTLAFDASGEADYLRDEGWPPWFIGWLESRLRHACSIEVAKYPRIEERGRIWTGKFAAALETVMAQHGPPTVAEVARVLPEGGARGRVARGPRFDRDWCF